MCPYLLPIYDKMTNKKMLWIDMKSQNEDRVKTSLWVMTANFIQKLWTNLAFCLVSEKGTYTFHDFNIIMLICEEVILCIQMLNSPVYLCKHT